MAPENVTTAVAKGSSMSLLPRTAATVAALATARSVVALVAANYSPNRKIGGFI